MISYFRIAYALSIVATLGGMYWYAYNDGARDERNAQAAIQAVVDIEQREKYEKVSAALELAKTTRQAATVTVSRNVARLVVRPVYSVSCIDFDGLRVANAAIAGQAVSEPGPAVQNDHTP